MSGLKVQAFWSSSSFIFRFSSDSIIFFYYLAIIIWESLIISLIGLCVSFLIVFAKSGLKLGWLFSAWISLLYYICSPRKIYRFELNTMNLDWILSTSESERQSWSEEFNHPKRRVVGKSSSWIGLRLVAPNLLLPLMPRMAIRKILRSPTEAFEPFLWAYIWQEFRNTHISDTSVLSLDSKIYPFCSTYFLRNPIFPIIST